MKKLNPKGKNEQTQKIRQLHIRISGNILYSPYNFILQNIHKSRCNPNNNNNIFWNNRNNYVDRFKER